MVSMLSFMQTLFLFLLAALSVASAWDISNENDRHGCQAHSKNPLDGCDQQRTIFVDLVSSSSKYKTVQSGRSSWACIKLSLTKKQLWHHYQTIQVKTSAHNAQV